jgi:hypothetical protein
VQASTHKALGLIHSTTRKQATKLNILLPHHLEPAFLAIYPNELKTYVHTETYSQMFAAALVIIAKSWKQPKCTLGAEWIHKLVHVDKGISAENR